MTSLEIINSSNGDGEVWKRSLYGKYTCIIWEVGWVSNFHATLPRPFFFNWEMTCYQWNVGNLGGLQCDQGELPPPRTQTHIPQTHRISVEYKDRNRSPAHTRTKPFYIPTEPHTAEQSVQSQGPDKSKSRLNTNIKDTQTHTFVEQVAWICTPDQFTLMQTTDSHLF